MPDLIVIGGGLAGSEAAWQAAQLGMSVKIFEMRPIRMTGAHTTSDLAELVCSNSLGSNLSDRASGLIKEELRILGSFVLDCAEQTAVPAGGALAVDRKKFSKLVTSRIETHPLIEIMREEVKGIPDEHTIIASGPLTSPSLSEAIKKLTGSEHLYFYDALSPIIKFESINMDKAFKASRYGRSETESGDYINCPFDDEEYIKFVDALINAEKIKLNEFEKDIKNGIRAGLHNYFEACLPVEVIAERGLEALAYGPMKPAGLFEQYKVKRLRAVVQLRQDNIAGSLYNMVGFQTNLKFTEQKRVFKMIPGLEQAEVVRYGQMHRNTFINSPMNIDPTLKFKNQNKLFFAGQITGAEGYTANIGTGLLAGINAGRNFNNKNLLVLPRTTMLGALCNYITSAEPENFQPMKENFGLLKELPGKSKMDKRERAKAYRDRSLEDLIKFVAKND